MTDKNYDENEKQRPVIPNLFMAFFSGECSDDDPEKLLFYSDSCEAPQEV